MRSFVYAHYSNISRENLNTCSIFPETGSFVFTLSKGFLVDNFKFEEPYDDEYDAKFAHFETGDLMYEHQDFLELLHRKDDPPYLPEKPQYKFV